MARLLQALVAITLIATLVGCGTTRRAPISDTPRPYPAARVPAEAPRASGSLAGTPGTPSPQQSYRSRWVAASWNDVPGWQDDQLQDAWNAWLQNCVRPGPLFAPLCKDVRQLMLGSDDGPEHCPLPRNAAAALQQVAPDKDLLLFMFGLSQGMRPQS